MGYGARTRNRVPVLVQLLGHMTDLPQPVYVDTPQRRPRDLYNGPLGLFLGTQVKITCTLTNGPSKTGGRNPNPLCANMIEPNIFTYHHLIEMVVDGGVNLPRQSICLYKTLFLFSPHLFNKVGCKKEDLGNHFICLPHPCSNFLIL